MPRSPITARFYYARYRASFRVEKLRRKMARHPEINIAHDTTATPRFLTTMTMVMRGAYRHFHSAIVEAGLSVATSTNRA